jgi:hypothetical protein
MPRKWIRTERARSADLATTAVGAWLVERASLPDLATRVGALELGAHASLVETEPARRHWLLLRDEMSSPEHPLRPLHEVISALSNSPIASRFYAFRLGASLQFAASSHPDWVIEKMPYVAHTEAGTYDVSGEFTRDVGDAVRLVEEELTRSGIEPFFGSAAHYELPILLESLARQGSSVEPAAIQRGDRYRLLVSHGKRECDVIGTRVFFAEGRRRTQASYASIDAAAAAIHRFLDQGAPADGVRC